jgi:hypothetical protein
MSGVISLLVDFSNGTTKSFSQIAISGRMSVTQALDAAAGIAPGLVYEFDGEFTDRGGRHVGTIKSVDGVGETDDHEWGVWLNGRVIGSLRQVVPESVTPFGEIDLAPGDSILLKPVAR